MKPLSGYARTGVVLVTAGGIAAPIFYFVAGSVALTAFALSMALLGFVSLLLARAAPQLPPRAAEAVLQAGLENVAALLEELGVHTPALYVPSRIGGGKAQALVPLTGSPDGRLLRGQLPQRLIVEIGNDSGELGLLLATSGTTALQFLDGPPGASSAELEGALTQILVGALDVARGVQVTGEGGRYDVRVDGVRLDHAHTRLDGIVGSPLASVVATVVAEGVDAPVAITAEHRDGSTATIRLERAA